MIHAHFAIKRHKRDLLTKKILQINRGTDWMEVDVQINDTK